MIRSRKQIDTGALVDLHSDEAALAVELLSFPGAGPLLPEPRPQPHEHGCWCVRCHNAGGYYADYLHNKRMEEL